jgi:hypothetical protein
MMPTAAMPAPRAATPAAHDRKFYSGLAVLMALIVFVGFAPTFYLRTYFGGPVSVTGATSLTPLAQLHGFVFTAWVILFVIQTSLVASRRVAVHRRLGLAAIGLAALMTIVGVMTAIAAARRGSAPPGFEPLVFLVVPVFDIVLFVGFITMAVLRRGEKEAHKRLMLLAYVAIMPAAVARLPGMIALGPAGFMIAFLPAVAGAVYDRWSRGRVSPVYWWGIALLYLSLPGRLAFANTPVWRAIAEYVMR